MAKDYYIKPGKSVVTKRGVVGPGRKVTEDDFTGGEKTINALLNSKTNPLTEQKPAASEKKSDGNDKKTSAPTPADGAVKK